MTPCYLFHHATCAILKPVAYALPCYLCYLVTCPVLTYTLCCHVLTYTLSLPIPCLYLYRAFTYTLSLPIPCFYLHPVLLCCLSWCQGVPAVALSLADHKAKQMQDYASPAAIAVTMIEVRTLSCPGTGTLHRHRHSTHHRDRHRHRHTTFHSTALITGTDLWASMHNQECMFLSACS